MDKSKWRSKAVYMGVTLALVLSLLGIVALPPVMAQGVPDLGVTVDTDKDEYCVCENITVTANITNSGGETAYNVSSNITWDPPGGVNYTSGPTPDDFELGAGNSTNVEFVLHCYGASNTTLNVTAWGKNATGAALPSVSGFKNIVQYDETDLTVTIFEPDEGDSFHVCENFPLTFQIKNTGTAPALDVNGTIFPSANVNVQNLPCGMSYTTGTLPRLDPGETFNWTVGMHCCGCDVPPLISSIHVIPNGEDYCTGTQTPNVHSDIVHMHQTYNVTCDAEDSKVGHNVTFTTTLGDCAVFPVAWNWTFGDGSSDNGTTNSSPFFTTHQYVTGNWTPGYTATVNVVDNVTVNGTCNVTVKIYDALTASCNVTPLDFTKVCHNLTFNGTAIGGFPEAMCNYTWEWEFGDNTTASGAGYNSSVQHHYNATGTYNATFTVSDDCLNNTANCTVNVRVYEPLSANCSVSSNVTKVCHNVTFSGMAVGGVPEWPAPDGCNYTWEWEFGDGNSTSGIGRSDCPGTSYHYGAEGNYTANFTVSDDCWNNTATCNATVRVFPPIEVTCNATPRVQHICHAVNFTANVTGGVPNSTFNYTWNFGDPFATWWNPNTSMEQDPSHTYMCVGNYTATVKVCDDLDPPNCANCSVNVTIYIEAPELISPPQNAQLTSKNVTFEWENIGCVNYTLVVHQKDNPDTKVLIVNVGKNSTYTGILFNHNWGWYVIARGMCDWVISDTWYFQVDAPDTGVIVMSPNGGELWAPGSQQSVTWAASPTDGEIDIEYSSDGGASWNPVASGLVNDGAEPWTVPDIESDQCLVRVTVNDPSAGSAQDTSDDLFTIGAAPTVTVISPNGGESYIGGSTQNITWTATDNVGVTSVDLYLWDGDTWSPIAMGEANDGTYSWTVPGIDSDQCLVKAEASDAIGLMGSDTSDEVFAITTDETYPDVTVNYPNGGEVLTGGSEVVITWEATEFQSPTGGMEASQSDLTIDIYLSSDGGATWATTVATGEDNDGAFPWTVPDINSGQCLIRVDATDDFANVGTDTSNGVFGITSEPTCPASYNISLAMGWNLISLPLIPTNSTIEAVLAGVSGPGSVTQVWAWDAQTQSYLSYIPGVGGTLTTMEDGPGYWVSANDTATLTVTGVCMPDPPEMPPSYTVYAGWNLIGLKSVATRTTDDYLRTIAGLYSVLWGYGSDYILVYPSPPGTGQMTPGSGYWIYMSTGGTIIPPGN